MIHVNSISPCTPGCIQPASAWFCRGTAAQRQGKRGWLRIFQERGPCCSQFAKLRRASSAEQTVPATSRSRPARARSRIPGTGAGPEGRTMHDPFAGGCIPVLSWSHLKTINRFTWHPQVIAPFTSVRSLRVNGSCCVPSTVAVEIPHTYFGV